MNIESLQLRAVLELQVRDWMAVHGNLVLALKHPGNQGPSARRMKTIIAALERIMKDSGAFTAEEVTIIQLDREQAIGELPPVFEVCGQVGQA